MKTPLIRASAWLGAGVLALSLAAAPVLAQPADPAKEPPKTEPTKAPAKEPAKEPPKEQPKEPATTEKPAAEKPTTTAKEQFVYVSMKTSKGEIVIELNQEKAPISVANFLAYADSGFYDGTVFHRVIGTFMIQGGGFTKDMTQKPTRAGIKNEWKNGLKNTRGTVAMARKGGDADSGTSQFFINVVNNDGSQRTNLDAPQPDGAAYAVFGRVVAGMDVADSIKLVKTGVDPKTGMSDVPVEPVVIEKVKKLTDAEAAKYKTAAPDKK